MLDFYEDFNTSIFGISNGLITQTSGTNAGFRAQNSEGYRPGIVEAFTGNTTGGRIAVYTDSMDILLSGYQWNMRSDVRFPELSNPIQGYTFRSGFGDNVSGEFLDGCFFRYTNIINSGAFECVTRNNGTETTATSNVVVAANTWYKLEIVVNQPATNVDFYINTTASPVRSITTNIPRTTGRNVGAVPLSLIASGTGINNRRAQIDLFMLSPKVVGTER